MVGNKEACLDSQADIPREDGIQEQMKGYAEDMLLPYAELLTEFQEKGWRTTTYPVEVRRQGFVSLSTKCFLRDIGFMSVKVKKVLKDLSEETEKVSSSQP